MSAPEPMQGVEQQQQPPHHQAMELDENLHSRQLAVYGREVMKRITAANVLVSGANGLGAEVGAWGRAWLWGRVGGGVACLQGCGGSSSSSSRSSSSRKEWPGSRAAPSARALVHPPALPPSPPPPARLLLPLQPRM